MMGWHESHTDEIDAMFERSDARIHAIYAAMFNAACAKISIEADRFAPTERDPGEAHHQRLSHQPALTE